MARRTKVSSISLNIPAAGLGSRPPSIVSTSTLDEGGFNEPYPEIKAKLKPHEDSPCVPSESTSSGSKTETEPIYAVPHKLTNLGQQKSTTSTDSAASQVTVIPQQKSVDSDIMYNAAEVITNSVLAELESQESFEKGGEDNKTASEPFLIALESLKSSDRVTLASDVQKAEANILDLNDVEYADASDVEPEQEEKKAAEADAMTPAEAENLLSSK